MSRYRDLASFASLTLVWGLSFPAVEVALSTIPPLLLAAFRFDLSGALLVGYAVLAGGDWRPSTRDDLVAIVGGGVFFIALGNGVWFIGQQLTTSALSGLMTGLIPLLTAACSWVLVPEDRLSRSGVLGLLVGFAGALLIMLPGPGDAALFAPGVVGKSLMFAGAVATALGSVLVRRARVSVSSAALTGWAMLLGSGLLHVLSPAVGEAAGTATAPATTVAALLYLGVVSSALAYLLYFRLLGRRSAIELNLVAYVTPVVAATAGWLLFGERLAPSVVWGFLVIVVGFGLMKRRALRDELGRLGVGRGS